ncbi:hypothetical protein ACP6JD_008360 [Aspergillus fumigatus]
MIQSVNDPPLSNPENLQEKGIASRDASLAEDEKKYAATLAYRQDAFGDESNAEVKYKVMKWWQCGLLMVAETVSLGVLSLPAAVAGLGLVPSVILLVSLGIIATYTGYVLGQFKLQYPWVHNMGLAGEVVFGSWGREILGAAQMLLLVFIMASHILTFVIAMNTLTDHGTCSIVFGVAGLIVSFILSLPRTLAKMSWLSLNSNSNPTNWHAAGHAAYFGLMAELKDPRDFPKALMLLQSVDVCLYIIAAIVIYVYGGDEIASPALGSADPLISKVAYGIALPTIIIAGVINGHVAIKYVYLRIFANKKERIHKRDWVAVSSWVAIALSLWTVAWIIAEAIPVFSNLLSLITALFASWFTYGLSGIFWLYLNRGQYLSSPRKMFLTIVNLFCLVFGAVLCGLGLYVSGKAIHDNPSSMSFSCANNA